MQCSRCHRDAIVFQPYSGLHLCDQHLITDVEAKAKKVIRAQGWLRPGDHIAVLLSGDQSSSALLYFLKRLTAHRRDIRISAITMTFGRDAPPCEISRTKHIAEWLDTELFEISLSEKSQPTVGIIMGKNTELSPLQLISPSQYIPVETPAGPQGITKIAWGLCLDDAAGVVLEYVIRGDGEKLAMGSSSQELLPRICPFISITAEEISLYAALCGCGNLPAISHEEGDGLQKDTMTMLDNYTNNHPATKYALLNLGENLAGNKKGMESLIHACEREFLRCNNGSREEDVKVGAY
jgi:tRNA(Ile)-lysidine synthase TilS/MesJ